MKVWTWSKPLKQMTGGMGPDVALTRSAWKRTNMVSKDFMIALKQAVRHGDGSTLCPAGMYPGLP